MPVVEKPKGRRPLFGDGAQVVIGGGLVQQLREWQRKKREARSSTNEED